MSNAARNGKPPNELSNPPRTRRTEPSPSKPVTWDTFVSWIGPDEIYRTDEPLKARRLSQRLRRWIEYRLPALVLDRRQMVFYARDSNGNKKLRARSLKIARTEPMRTAKRSRAKHVIEQGEKDIAWFEKRRNWLVLLLRFVSPETEDWQRRSDPLRSLKMLPSVISVMFWSAAFVSLLCAELNSSTNLLMTAGMGFADSWTSAFLAILVVVLLPLTTLKFLDANLGQQGRVVFDRILSGIALPLSVIIIFLFARTIGGSHGEVSIIGNTDTGGFNYWLLYMASMFGLAVAVAMAGKSLKRTCQHFYEFNSVPNPVFVSISQRIQQIDNAIAGIRADCNEMRRVLGDLENEADAFADANCDELRQLKLRFWQAQESFLSHESGSR